MQLYTGQFYTENSDLKEIAGLDPARFNRGVTLYEVLRVQSGCCLFLEDHLHRLRESLHLSGFQFTVDPDSVRTLLQELIRVNHLPVGNIKIVLHFPVPDAPRLYAFFIPHAYPDASMVAKGVDTDLFRASRLNPNVKRIVPGIRKKIDRFIHAGRLYEALLVKDNCITEGSRSNVFFIRGGMVLTPPGSEVLKGITRQKIIELCKKLHYNVIEESISTNRLNEMDAAFLTGTSPKVLGIRRIGSVVYPINNPIISSLAKSYDDLIAAYIQDNARVL